MKTKTWGKLFLPIIAILASISAFVINPSSSSGNQLNLQLVTKEKESIFEKTPSNGLITYQDLQLGEHFSGAIVTDDEQLDHLYLWGDNRNHKVNSSKNVSELSPVEKILPENKIKHLAIGLDDNAGAITIDKNGDNHLYMWGNDRDGETGKGSSGNIDNYLEIKLDHKIINDLQIGYNHSAVLTTDKNNLDHLYLMGSNAYGQLGNPAYKNSFQPLELEFPEAKIKDLSLGYIHSSVVTTDQDGQDHLYLWGDNRFGQIGNNTTITQHKPTKISLTETKIKEVNLGYHYSSVVTTDQDGQDHLYLWGDNIFGQIGDGKVDNHLSPTKILLPDNKIKKVDLGNNHTGVITTDQKGNDHLYLWGYNANGELGNGNMQHQYKPTEILLAEKNIQTISLGNNHSGFITIDERGKNNLYLWGDNLYGQLGNGNTPHQYQPLAVPLPENKIKTANLGYYHSSVVTIDAFGDNHLYLWGDHRYGKLARKNTLKHQQPTKVLLRQKNIKAVALGRDHSSVVTTDQEDIDHLYMWGNNLFGQLGNHSNIRQSKPTEVILPGTWIKKVSLGEEHSGAIITNKDGKDHLYMWGYNRYGQLGTNNISNYNHPTKVSFSEEQIKDLSLGNNHSSVVTTDQDGQDHLYMWGSNQYGQLGIGSTVNQHLPIKVVLPEKKIKNVSLGHHYSSVITIDEEGNERLYLWGYNQYGQLGINNKINQYAPTRVTLPESKIEKVDLGVYHVSVITKDEKEQNHLYLWGDNRYGQLGDGSTTTRHSPIEVFFPEDQIQQMSIGSYHSSVVTTDRTGQDHLYMWGRNYHGQLGFLRKNSTITPTKISQTKVIVFDDIRLNELSINHNKIRLNFEVDFAKTNIIYSNKIKKQHIKIHVEDLPEFKCSFTQVDDDTFAGHLLITGLSSNTNYKNFYLELLYWKSKDTHKIVIPSFTTLK